jgi:hypothetical protein
VFRDPADSSNSSNTNRQVGDLVLTISGHCEKGITRVPHKHWENPRFEIEDVLISSQRSLIAKLVFPEANEDHLWL